MLSALWSRERDSGRLPGTFSGRALACGHALTTGARALLRPVGDRVRRATDFRQIHLFQVPQRLFRQLQLLRVLLHDVLLGARPARRMNLLLAEGGNGYYGRE